MKVTGLLLRSKKSPSDFVSSGFAGRINQLRRLIGFVSFDTSYRPKPIALFLHPFHVKASRIPHYGRYASDTSGTSFLITPLCSFLMLPMHRPEFRTVDQTENRLIFDAVSFPHSFDFQYGPLLFLMC